MEVILLSVLGVKVIFMWFEEEFVNLCHILGTEKILFGTDSPWADQKEYVDRFLSLPFSKEEQAQILYENAAGLICL